MNPTFGSLFSGIGGFDLGLERAGFTPVFQCDNDPFCNRVLALRWPEVTRYLDVRDVGLGLGRNGSGGEPAGRASANGSVPPADDGRWQAGSGLSSRVDLICGGFPCQDLSVAGKRGGLNASRSGLWFEFHRILSQLRPTFCLIENVPGLLSSNRGRDFGIVLGGLDELGYVVGWAVLDSQYFGVPQRRRRVYIVGGPSRESVQQVLSICEGGDWHSQARRASRQNLAGPIAGGAYGTGRRTEDDPNLVTIPSLMASGRGVERTGESRGQDPLVLDNETYVAFGGNRTSGPIEVATAVNAHGGTGRSDFESETFLVTHSLRADGFDASEDGTGRGTPLTVIQDARGHDKAQNGLGIEQSEVMYTLDGASQHAIAFTERTRKEGRNFEASEELSYALTNPGAGGRAHSRSLYDGMGVRRLTPVECERLQGFPDGWTQLDGRTADGPRYKALGNAVTVPVIQYLGERIREVMRW